MMDELFGQEAHETQQIWEANFEHAKNKKWRSSDHGYCRRIAAVIPGACCGCPCTRKQEQTQKETAEKATDVSEAPTEEVTITGSRIKNTEFTSASPVQIITSERSALAGTISASEVLQSSSVAAGSGQINNTFTGYVVDGGDGINTISLRGLGAQRSLVLLNGRRLPAAGVGGTVGPVDLNIIPQSMVERYEILKDGASSIYGSDAVAGVVNVITKTDFDGQSVSGSFKQTQHGGAAETAFSAQVGKGFDKGHFTIATEYYHQSALRISDRDQLSCPQDYLYYGSDRADVIDPNTGTYKCNNTWEGNVLAYNWFNPDYAGGWYTYAPDPSNTTGQDPVAIPGWSRQPYAARSFNDPREQNKTVISPVQRLTSLAQGEYRPDWAGGGELYTEIMLHNRQSSQTSWRQFFPYYSWASPVNPFAAAAEGAGTYAEPVVLVPSNSDQKVDVFRGLFGLRKEWRGWSFDTYLSHSVSKGVYHHTVIPYDRVEAGTATDQNTGEPLFDGDGNFVDICPPGASAGCVPLDLFNPATLLDGQFSPDALAYYFVNEEGNTRYTQTIFESTATGDLFKLPYGNLSGAVGVSVRGDRIKDVPGEFTRAGNSWGYLTAGVTKGSDTLSEIFGEIEIPLLRKLPMIEDLTLNVSGRYSRYRSVGSDTTYKAGLNWALNHTIRLRATRGTSFRAPALYELYLADQTSFLAQSIVDPCIGYGLPDSTASATVKANCAADGLPDDWSGGGSSAQITTGGGLGRLKPETSTASTVGLVLTPVDTGFSLAVDYWKIEVKNQISSSSAGIVGACYSDPNFRSVSGFCDLFTRDLDPDSPNFGTIENIDASYRNIPTEATSGLDFTISYEHEFNFGKLSVDSQITKTAYDRSQLFSGAPVYDYNGLIGDPTWVGDLQARFKRGDWTYSWTMNYTGPASNLGFGDEDGVSSVFYAPGATYAASVPSFVTHDLSVRYIGKNWEVTGGIDNVLDKDPPIIGAGDASWSASRIGSYAWSSQYYTGLLGRTGFMSFIRKF